MTDEAAANLHRRAQEAMATAMSLDADLRDAYLSDLEAESPELRNEVEALLASLRYANEADFSKSSQDSENVLFNLLELEQIHEKIDASAPSKSINDSATESFDYSSGDSSSEAQLPDDLTIGPYQIKSVLGVGGYGVVYLAEDAHLHRRVAIKLANTKKANQSRTDQAFLEEARRVAQLDHPGIVRVLHFGQGDTYAWYLAMEYIDGPSLKQIFDEDQYSTTQIIEVFIRIAEAVHHANSHNIFHCDLKPANILLRDKWVPCVVDFGMAVHVREQQSYRGRVAGTPAYMSPEQVRGENHRLDGRTDIWSLGVMLYEALTRVKPFLGDSAAKLFDEILNRDPRPLRQIDSAIPAELERICLRCLSKRMADRYTTAADIAAELQHWLDHAIDIENDSPASNLSLSATTQPGVAKVIPRGLRSFEADDADFFLDLLPGPRTRDGLPEALRRWITAIQSPESPLKSAVCVLYGPSGSGKSSILRAGVLPRLGDEVAVISADAGNEELTANLRTVLQQVCPQLPVGTSLSAALAWIRRHGPGGKTRKLLLVFDQFEQWLHASKGLVPDELTLALRHCDGDKLQCLLTVRSDFWLGTTRFMEQLEARLVEGINCFHVDLFDYRHARKVLRLFGQAYGCLPLDPDPLSQGQQAFIDKAVLQIGEQGWVMPVRLALFAEMMKSHEWNEATLLKLGGEQGVGVAFLEQAFDSPVASPAHRRNQRAAEAVLESLLPDDGIDLKGQSRTRAELLEASGLTGQGHRFKELIDILDSQLRLITPVEYFANTVSPAEEPPGSSMGMQTYSPAYQLAHDYLVPSLREWLTSKKHETREGRARLCLRQRTKQWQRTKENRFLPSPIETLSICAFTRRDARTDPEKKMLRRAFAQHGKNSGLLLLVGVVLAAITYWLTPEAPLPIFLDASRRANQRIDAFERIELSSSSSLGPVLSALKREQDSQVLEHTVTGMSQFARELSAQESNAEDSVRDLIVEVMLDMLSRSNTADARNSGAIRTTIFETLATLASPPDVLDVIARYFGQIEPTQAKKMAAYLRKLDYRPSPATANQADFSDSVQPQQLITSLIKLMSILPPGELRHAAVGVLDPLSAKELVTEFIEAFAGKPYDYAEESFEIYTVSLPANQQESKADQIMVELAGRLKQDIALVQAGKEYSAENLEYVLRGIQGVAGFLRQRPGEVTRDVLYLLKHSEKFAAGSVLDVACEALASLRRIASDADSPAMDLFAPLSALLVNRDENVEARCAAARAMVSFPQSESIPALAEFALSSVAPVQLRSTCVEALAAIAKQSNIQRSDRDKIVAIFAQLIRQLEFSEHLLNDVTRAFSEIAPSEEIGLLMPLLAEKESNLAASLAIYTFLVRYPEDASRIIRDYFSTVVGLSREQRANLFPIPASIFAEICQRRDLYEAQEILLASSRAAPAFAAICANNPNSDIRVLAKENLRMLLNNVPQPTIDPLAPLATREEQLRNWRETWQAQKNRLVLNGANQLDVR